MADDDKSQDDDQQIDDAEDQTQGDEVEQDDSVGWSYLEDYAQVRFNGESVPEREAHIVVKYYRTGPVPVATESSSGTTDTGT